MRGRRRRRLENILIQISSKPKPPRLMACWPPLAPGQIDRLTVGKCVWSEHKIWPPRVRFQLQKSFFSYILRNKILGSFFCEPYWDLFTVPKGALSYVYVRNILQQLSCSPSCMIVRVTATTCVHPPPSFSRTILKPLLAPAVKRARQQKFSVTVWSSNSQDLRHRCSTKRPIKNIYQLATLAKRTK